MHETTWDSLPWVALESLTPGSIIVVSDSSDRTVWLGVDVAGRTVWHPTVTSRGPQLAYEVKASDVPAANAIRAHAVAPPEPVVIDFTNENEEPDVAVHLPGDVSSRLQWHVLECGGAANSAVGEAGLRRAFERRFHRGQENLNLYRVR